jgi:endonuclease YncB( thermonuclease family)
VTASQTHAGTVLAVHDGDTITVAIPLASTRRANGDLGFHLYAEHGHVVLHCPIRLLGCNAIELKDPGGREAQQNLASLLPIGTVVTLRTVAADKWGTRWDAAITLPDGTDLVPHLIATGWAAPWTGQGPKPVPAWPRQETTT